MWLQVLVFFPPETLYPPILDHAQWEPTCGCAALSQNVAQACAGSTQWSTREKEGKQLLTPPSQCWTWTKCTPLNTFRNFSLRNKNGRHLSECAWFLFDIKCKPVSTSGSLRIKCLWHPTTDLKGSIHRGKWRLKSQHQHHPSVLLTTLLCFSALLGLHILLFLPHLYKCSPFLQCTLQTLSSHLKWSALSWAHFLKQVKLLLRERNISATQSTMKKAALPHPQGSHASST